MYGTALITTDVLPAVISLQRIAARRQTTVRNLTRRTLKAVCLAAGVMAPFCGASARVHGRIVIGVTPFFYSYPYPYYYPYYYPYQPPYYYYRYYTPPDVAGQPPTAAAEPAPSYWYFCQSANAYYPYVSSCPGGWRAVPVTPSPPANTPPPPEHRP